MGSSFVLTSPHSLPVTLHPLHHAGDEGHESDEGNEEGHEAQGHEGCSGGGACHEGNEGHESHEGNEGHEEGYEGHESNEGYEGNEEVNVCGGWKCDLSVPQGDGHVRCELALSRGGVPCLARLYNLWQLCIFVKSKQN